VTAYVLDASVAAKWFLPAGETLTDEAVALLKRFAAGRWVCWCRPVLAGGGQHLLESRTQRENVDGFGARGGQRIVGLRHPPQTPSLPLLGHALEIATEFERTVYDAIYVALAVESNHSLVTADERLANAMAAYFPVRWLGTV